MSLPFPNAVAEAHDPRTSPARLAELAQVSPELWSTIAAHPNVYPGLLAWMAAQGFVPASVIPRRRRRAWPWVVAGVAAATVLALVIVTVVVMLPRGGSGAWRDALAALESEDVLTVSGLDIANLMAATGTSLPANPTEAQFEGWIDEVTNDPQLPIFVSGLGFSTPWGQTVVAAGGTVSVTLEDAPGTVGGGVFLRDPGTAVLDAHASVEGDGRWFEDDLDRPIERIDGAVYFATEVGGGLIPEHRPELDDSLAGDEALVAVVDRLAGTNPVMWMAEWSVDKHGFIFDDEGVIDDVRVAGSATSVRGGELLQTLVLAFDDPDAAAEASQSVLAIDELRETLSFVSGRDDLDAVTVTQSGALLEIVVVSPRSTE